MTAGEQAISQYIADLERFERPDAAVFALEELVADFGFDYYGIIRQPKPNENPMSLVLAGRWPEGWPAMYVHKKYVVIDPTIRYLGHARQGFRWRETIAAFRNDPHRKRMERMMAEARKFGLEDGYIFPVHGRHGLVGNLTFGGRPVDLTAVEMALFDSLAKRVFWKLLGWRQPQMNGALAGEVDVRLTRREMEALNYLADGMTSNEIAAVLQISPNTVDWYMNGVQTKLRAKNRHHTVAIAFRLGLIS